MSNDVELLMFHVTEEDVYFASASGEPVHVPHVKALVRHTAGTDIPIAIVNRTHKVILVHEVLSVVDNLIRARVGAANRVHVRDKLAYNGGMCIREYTFGGTATHVREALVVELRIVVCYTYGSNALHVYAGVVIDNVTLVTWVFERRIRKMSSGDVRIDTIEDAINGPWKYYSSTVERLKRMATRYVTNIDARRAIHSLTVSGACARCMETSVVVENARHGNTLLALLLGIAKAMADPSTGCVTGTLERDNLEANRLRRAVQVHAMTRTELWKRLENE